MARYPSSSGRRRSRSPAGGRSKRVRGSGGRSAERAKSSRDEHTSSRDRDRGSSADDRYAHRGAAPRRHDLPSSSSSSSRTRDGRDRDRDRGRRPSPASNRRDDGARSDRGKDDKQEESSGPTTSGFTEKVEQRQLRKAMEQELSEEEQAQAAQMARIAARAEARAAERKRLAAAAEGRRADAEVDDSNVNGTASAPVDRSAGPSGANALSSRNGNGAQAAASVEAAPTDEGAPSEPGKVVFRTRKQREEDALRRLDHKRQAREAQQAQEQTDRVNRRKQQEEDRRSNGRSARDRDRGVGSSSSSSRFYDRDRNERSDNGTSASNKGKDGVREAVMPEGKMLEAIKQQYLGKVKVKKPMKHSEKHARIFKMDWDADEDTSKDLNPIYSSRADGALLFGRGTRGGIDTNEQRDSTAYMRQVLERRRGGEDMTDKEFRAQRAELEIKERVQDKELAPKPRALHWSEKPLVDMTDRDWRIVREDHDIHVQGGRVPLPARSWDEMNLLPKVQDGIRALGFDKPSPIQMAAIPIGMQQRDLIGVAETGSGKTAAFVIPMLMFILKQDPSKLAACPEEGPLAVIMAPTRELAQQIEEQTVQLCRFTGVRTVAVVGGNSIEAQATKMRAGCEVIIATPGRLLDCLRNRYVVFNQCNYLVLDEADRMIDMGFEPQVEAVIDSMNCGMKSEIEEEVIEQERKTTDGEELYRVTIMFSATMPREVEGLAVKYMRFPATIRIGDRHTGKNQKISQHVHLLSGEGAKKAMLLKLARMTAPPIIVFANSKNGCDNVARILNSSGFSAVVLHSGKKQSERELNLEGFKNGQFNILVATDVAGRGLDIANITHVINYDMSSDIQRYTHRIGRTGRAGKSGRASTLLTDQDAELFYALVEYLKSTKSEVPADLARHPMSTIKPGDFVDQKLVDKYMRKKEDKW